MPSSVDFWKHAALFVDDQAVEQMEERLAQFIESASTLDFGDLESAGVLRFVRSQVFKLAADCLQKSKDKLITSAYFYELSESLQTLLHQVSTMALLLLPCIIIMVIVVVKFFIAAKVTQKFWSEMELVSCQVII